MSNFKNHISRLDSPAEYAFSITPSDSSNLPNATRGIYIGGSGASVKPYFWNGSTWSSII